MLDIHFSDLRWGWTIFGNLIARGKNWVANFVTKENFSFSRYFETRAFDFIDFIVENKFWECAKGRPRQNRVNLRLWKFEFIVNEPRWREPAFLERKADFFLICRVWLRVICHERKRTRKKSMENDEKLAAVGNWEAEKWEEISTLESELKK